MEANISVLMSVYKNDIAENVRVAVESVINQTLKPKQVVMVIDGPVPDELKQELLQLEKDYPIYENVWLEENLGTGGALENTWLRCKYEYIAKMDSDDVSIPTRFEKEINFLKTHPDIDVVGGLGQEFYNEIENLAGLKKVPETHQQIVKFLKSRSPFCHQSIMAKRSIIEKAGGYKPWFYAEDYYLFIRMYLVGAKFYNIQEILVYLRINQNTFARRHGLKYYRSIKGLLKFMYKNKIINYCKYTKEKMIRFVGHVIVPRQLKDKLYRKYLRG